MAREIINYGTAADDGTGDTARDALVKCDNNFAELYGIVDNSSSQEVIVYSLADLPAPIAGIIPLASSTVYEFRASLNFGTDRIQMGTNTSMKGANSLAISLTYTGASTFINATDTPCSIQELTISATASGARVVAFSATSLKIFRMDNCTIVCDRFADFSGTDWAARLTNVSIFPFTTGAVTFAGTCRSFNYDTAGIIPVSGVIFDLGSCVFESFVVSTIVYNLPAGATFISGLASSGNISSSGRGLVSGCQGNNTGGTELVGVSENDSRWKFANNTPIRDSKIDFIGSFDSNATATTITAAGTYYKVNSGALFVESRASGFTLNSSGRATYVGVEGIIIPTTFCVSFEPVSGSNKDVAFKLAKNGVVDGPEMIRRVSAGAAGHVTIAWQSDLVTGDYLEVYVTNTTDTVDILISSLIFRGD